MKVLVNKHMSIRAIRQCHDVVSMFAYHVQDRRTQSKDKITHTNNQKASTFQIIHVKLDKIVLPSEDMFVSCMRIFQVLRFNINTCEYSHLIG